jgi:hypothetical protein
MATLPPSVEALIKKSKKPLKYVLLRLPKEMPISDLDGVSIDLTDLKVSSTKELTAVTDRHTNPDRASACPLFPDGESIKVGDAFVAHIQLVKSSESKKSKKVSILTDQESVKKEITKKQKKLVKQDSD